ncbi:hypothetical protein NM688_g2351 [Phlebia brevispora]|uniref:Uncharacterized protein n=1 Tax=Phlebia brevispora TaxID=194682 RepID=A0ACC1T8Q2_9APHY|nr:hypothetical protein NM688_g2351 [Phlebia brevispora]
MKTYLERIVAAVKARRNPDFARIARTVARNVTMFRGEDAERTFLWTASGGCTCPEADAAFMESPRTMDDVSRLFKALAPRPAMTNILRSGLTGRLSGQIAQSAPSHSSCICAAIAMKSYAALKKKGTNPDNCEDVTRKFTLQDDAFPTYEQLTSQLYKAFAGVNAFYLSEILLCPNANAPNSRILIGKAAHNASDYDKHTKSYQGRSWPGAVLRFTVLDEVSDSDTVTPEQRPISLEDNGLGSYRWSTTTSTAINTREGSDVSQAPDPAPDAGRAPTAEEPETQRAHKEDARRIILDRIRERTFTRTSAGPAILSSSSPKFMDTIPTMPITLRDIFKTPDASANDQSPDLNNIVKADDSSRKADIDRLSQLMRHRLATRGDATASSSIVPVSSSRRPLSAIENDEDVSQSNSADRRLSLNAGTPLAANPSRLQRLQCALSSRTATDSAHSSKADSASRVPVAPSSADDESDHHHEPESEQEQSDASQSNPRRCRHSYDWGSCVYPHCISNLKPSSSNTRPYSRIADSPASWSSPLPTLSRTKYGLPYIDVPERSPLSSVPSGVTLYNGDPRADSERMSDGRTFEEASERVVDLGLDFLRRANHSCDSMDGTSDIPALRTVVDDGSDRDAHTESSRPAQWALGRSV